MLSVIGDARDASACNAVSSGDPVTGAAGTRDGVCDQFRGAACGAATVAEGIGLEWIGAERKADCTECCSTGSGAVRRPVTNPITIAPTTATVVRAAMLCQRLLAMLATGCGGAADAKMRAVSAGGGTKCCAWPSAAMRMV